MHPRKANTATWQMKATGAAAMLFAWCSPLHAANLAVPPVAERLPQHPYVEVLFQSIGKYGGTWRQVVLGGGHT